MNKLINTVSVMKFRKDINGLRAIAVIAVVCFHFNSSWMPGGFSGVDVFFVISGFLMTGIIFRGIEREEFSIFKFYIDRANRIIPALAVLCIILLFFGWFYITPIDYKVLGKHAASSIGFYSNMLYWSEAGYFDVSSHEKWLLHTWSLSVEWQFYIIYPLVLITMRTLMSVKMMKVTVLLGAIVGFIFCVIATYKWPAISYYTLPTRAWEMMIGGVAYVYPINIQEKRKRFIEWLGLALIAFSFFIISKDDPWPSYLALYPVLGSFLIIQAQRKDSFVTSNSVFQKIGTWSYSIYLWHWPLVVAIYYFSLSEEFTYFGVGLSIFLGFLSNKYIEKIKFLNIFSSPLSYLKCKPVYIVLFVGIVGNLVFFNNGFEGHYPPKVVQAEKERLNKNPSKCMKSDDVLACYIGNKSNITAIIVGDSHASALATALADTMDLSLKGIVLLPKSSCPFILGVKHRRYGDECNTANIKRIGYLSNRYKNIPIFWVSRMSLYVYGHSNPSRILEPRIIGPEIYFTNVHYKPDADFFNELESNFNKTIAQLKDNHPVYLLLPTPEMRKNIPKVLSRNILLNIEDSDLSIDYNLYLERNSLIIKLINSVAKSNDSEVLDPIPYLCHKDRCMAQYKNRPIYYDGDHMSEFGNKLLTPMFSQIMENHSD